MLFSLGSIMFFYSADYVLNDVMEPHQRVRINVLLGLEEDISGAGYNVHQSEIAIGSGGLKGKGFLNGTHSSSCPNRTPTSSSVRWVRRKVSSVLRVCCCFSWH